jgi:hypothetical protein
LDLPEGITETDFINMTDKIVRSIAMKFRFGYHSNEDMMQQGRFIAIKAISDGKFDESKGSLESFLWSHIRNRLSNYKRDNYERPDLPCLKCPLNAYDPNLNASCSGCIIYNDKYDCQLFQEWRERNDRKKNLATPIGISEVQDENENSMKDMGDIGSFVEAKETLNLIDREISVQQRKNWIKLKHGNKLSNKARAELITEIHQIIAGDVDGEES